MSLRKKPEPEYEPDHGDDLRQRIERELQNPKIQAVVHYTKQEYPADVAYFAALVKERPADAVATLVWKHHAYMQMKHELKLRSIMRAEYDALPPENKARVDAELAKHPPQERDRALIVEVVLEKLRQKGINLDDDLKEGMGISAG